MPTSILRELLVPNVRCRCRLPMPDAGCHMPDAGGRCCDADAIAAGCRVPVCRWQHGCRCRMPIPDAGAGYRVPDARCRIPVPVVPDAGGRVPGDGCRVPDAVGRMPYRLPVPDAGCRMPEPVPVAGAGCRMPDAGCRCRLPVPVAGAGCRMPVAGCRCRMPVPDAGGRLPENKKCILWILQDEYVNILTASLQLYMNVYVCICIIHVCGDFFVRLCMNLNFVYGVAWTTCAYTQRTPNMSPPYSLPTPFVFFCVSSLFCCSHCRPPRGWPQCVLFCEICRPARSCARHLGRPVSCGKFVFPSHYLPLPILDVPSPVVNSSSHLITCHFPSWTSRLLW